MQSLLLTAPTLLDVDIADHVLINGANRLSLRLVRIGPRLGICPVYRASDKPSDRQALARNGKVDNTDCLQL
jgi:hypothetical protein